ncbi:MAG: DUF1365 family protein, partial [Pseudomonadota bacterium]
MGSPPRCAYARRTDWSWTMHSRIYEGTVVHRRFQPVAHRFRYRLFQMYLDLDEVDELFAKRWFWSSRKPAL